MEQVRLLVLTILFSTTLALSPGYRNEAEKLKQFISRVDEHVFCDEACMNNIILEIKENSEETKFKERPVYEYPVVAFNPLVDQAECDAVVAEYRFDCSPASTITAEACEAKGCCYDESIGALTTEAPVTSGPTLTAPSLGQPACFYPNNYVSYNFTDLTETNMGMSGNLQLVNPSGFPNEIQDLQIEFIYETDERLRVRIYDANNDRYETPYPVVPEVTTTASDPAYSVEVEEALGTFVVRRVSDSAILFDTRKAGPLVFTDQFLQLSSILSSSYIYGLGQHMDGLLLETNWYRRFMWNYDTGPKENTNLYAEHAFYLNFDNEADGSMHGVFLLNSNALDIVIQPTPAISFRPLGGILDFYIFVGPTPSAVVNQFTELISRPIMPPYWSLGYQQCRYDYYTTTEIRRIWKQTIDAGIPFDVQWADIDSMDAFKDFTYDPVNWAGFPEFFDDVHAAGMKFVLITDPGLDADEEPIESYFPYFNASSEQVFVMNGDGSSEFIGKTWIYNDTAYPDFTNPRTHVLWQEYLRQFHEVLPFDGIWLDMNEPSNFDNSFEACDITLDYNNPPYLPPNSEQHDKWLYYRTICGDAMQELGPHYNHHNLYGEMENIATSNALKAIRQERPFVISRSSFSGHGKYSGRWTGDTASTWFQFQRSIPDLINFGLFGIPMVGSDICGFGENTTIPLCTRWYQVGAFNPFARNHNNEFNIDQDPVSLGEPVVTAARNSLFERYRLLPTIYTLFYWASQTGSPVLTSLFYNFPEDPTTYAISTQYMYGNSLLFTPIVEEDATSVNAYFPVAYWYDWYTGSLSSTGGEYMVVEEVENYFPNIFIRGGSTVVTTAAAVTTTLSRKNKLQLEVALDEDGGSSGNVFFDDGVSIDSIDSGNFNLIEYQTSDKTIQSSVLSNGYTVEPMLLSQIRILGVQETAPVDCTYNGGPIACYFNEEFQTLLILTSSVNLLEEFTITWSSEA